MGALEHDVLVHLVGHDEEVVLHAHGGDRGELLAREDAAGGVVGRVEDQEARPRGDRGLERRRVEAEVGRRERDDARLRLRERDPGQVGVVERLEDDRLVAGSSSAASVAHRASVAPAWIVISVAGSCSRP